MRLQPPNIESRSSVAERIGNFLSGIVSVSEGIDGVTILLTLLSGLGLLGYVWFLWLLHFVRNGQFLLVGLLSTFFIVISLAAIARSYLAMAVVFGGAVICGVAFLSGASHVFLP